MPSPGSSARPAPGADRRPVQLERGDDEEHAGVDRAVARRARGRAGAAARRSRPRRRGAAARSARAAPQSSPRPRPRRRRARACACAARARATGPVEEDEPVRGRHEERQVVQPVAVDAPDQRAGHLADRREEDDAERLRAPLDRDAQRARATSTSQVEHAERRAAAWIRRVVVDREQGGEVAAARPDYGRLAGTAARATTGPARARAAGGRRRPDAGRRTRPRPRPRRPRARRASPGGRARRRGRSACAASRRATRRSTSETRSQLRTR